MGGHGIGAPFVSNRFGGAGLAVRPLVLAAAGGPASHPANPPGDRMHPSRPRRLLTYRRGLFGGHSGDGVHANHLQADGSEPLGDFPYGIPV